jgi:glucosamine-6-phosphate deaminase
MTCAHDTAKHALRTSHGRDDERNRDEWPDADHIAHVESGGFEQPESANQAVFGLGHSWFPGDGYVSLRASDVHCKDVRGSRYNDHVPNQARSDDRVRIYDSSAEMAVAAADHAERLINEAIAAKGRARIVVATGNAQIEFIDALVQKDVDWRVGEVFHLDEYIGLPKTHPSSFRYWIKHRVEDRVHPARMNYIEGDAVDIDGEMKRYEKLIGEAPLDLGFVGFGENGHIAFNDPPNADFDDPLLLKRVEIDDACRRQQAGEGHFKDIDSVPRYALTISCSGLFAIPAWISCVPEARKAEAVRNAVEGPIATACPGSLFRRHANATLYLDRNSAALLKL